jgi:hypothetical protein
MGVGDPQREQRESGEIFAAWKYRSSKAGVNAEPRPPSEPAFTEPSPRTTCARSSALRRTA